MTAHSAYFTSPLGSLELKASDTGITSIRFASLDHVSSSQSASPVLRTCIEQLQHYFRGDSILFDLPLELEGTEFQNRVWKELTRIPYGETISYLELAKRLGDEKCIRAAGTANGKNPVGIIVPCHRVIGANGKLVGYAGGLWRKEWLLKHEARFAPKKAGRLF